MLIAPICQLGHPHAITFLAKYQHFSVSFLQFLLHLRHFLTILPVNRLYRAFLSEKIVDWVVSLVQISDCDSSRSRSYVLHASLRDKMDYGVGSYSAMYSPVLGGTISYG